MKLSSDLISQFVELTKPVKETKKESTVYGTIVENEGNKYIRIDGSNVLTPITYTADNIPGERVTAMIKNHTVIVTGNITSPAARTEDVQAIDEHVNSNLRTDENGLEVGKEDTTNILFGADAIDIRDGSNVMATIRSGEIELGKNSVNLLINLCKGKLILEYSDTEEALLVHGKTIFDTVEGKSVISQELTTTDLTVTGKLTSANQGVVVHDEATPIDANTTLEYECLTNINTPSEALYYVVTRFQNEKSVTANRSQMALPHSSNSTPGIHYRYFVNGEWSAWAK